MTKLVHVRLNLSFIVQLGPDWSFFHFEIIAVHHCSLIVISITDSNFVLDRMEKFYYLITTMP